MTTKTSSCVDCGTTIIGERLRCPVCYEAHEASRMSFGKALVTWLVIVEIFVAVICGLVLAAKGCAS